MKKYKIELDLTELEYETFKELCELKRQSEELPFLEEAFAKTLFDLGLQNTLELYFPHIRMLREDVRKKLLENLEGDEQ